MKRIQFYSRDKHDLLQERTGYRVMPHSKLTLFAYRYKPHLWYVVEARSGMGVGRGPTMAESIQSARKHLRGHFAYATQCIKEYVKAHGIANKESQ